MYYSQFHQAPKFWRDKNIWCWVLFPLSWLYILGLKLHQLLYQLHIKKTYYFSVPVIVVGNISVGGTGKTPLVIWLASYLAAKGYRPGIISRGYSGDNRRVRVVTEYSSVTEVGDEALMVAQSCHCPVVISCDRVAAAEKIIHDFNCNIVISDDGLQHYALGRTLEIALVDGESRGKNNFCLPAGPLREPLQRLKSVDFVVVNSGNTLKHEYAMKIVPQKFYRVNDKNICVALDAFNHRKVRALAGIGNPKRFFNLLSDLGCEVIEHIFPDHYIFNANDLCFADKLPVIMTEKDAVKCFNLAGDNVWWLKIEAKLDDKFVSELLKRI